eukprot:CAMPEP_0116017602 /NCGR_PEP_ID=MMETSP0321-20121206/8142_1 /TAXON_ID=163516 /ORGANISM="Leptocylindrus danicus var. danicus, Strain B650" /LENGTH=570 /DNA_ID=CAMNT_0003487819 /DNA_START=108 /DNA_END=1817 /DNA_ORIENTATION=+
MGSQLSKDENDTEVGRKYMMAFSDNSLEINDFIKTNESGSPISVKYSKTFDTTDGTDNSSNSILSWHEEEHSVGEKEAIGSWWTNQCWGCIDGNDNKCVPFTQANTNETHPLSINPDHSTDLFSLYRCYKSDSLEYGPSAAKTLADLADTHFKRREYDKSLEVYSELLQMYEANSCAENEDLFPTVEEIESQKKKVEDVLASITIIENHRKHGQELEESGCYGEAMLSYSTALRYGVSNLGEVHPMMGSIWNDIGCCHWKRGEYNEAVSVLEKALDIHRTSHGVDQPATLNLLGCCYRSKGAYKSAIKSFMRSLNALSSSSESNNFALVGKTLTFLASAYGDLGKLNTSLLIFKDSLSLLETSLGPNHVDVAATLKCKGELYEKCGLYNDAMITYRRTLEIYKLSFGEKSIDVAKTLNSIGEIHRHRNEYDKALASYDAALVIAHDILGDKHHDVAAILHNTGRVYATQGEGERAKALQVFHVVLDIQKETLGKLHPDIGTTLESIGQVYENAGNYETAIHWYEKSLQQRTKILGNNHSTMEALRKKIRLLKTESCLQQFGCEGCNGYSW